MLLPVLSGTQEPPPHPPTTPGTGPASSTLAGCAVCGKPWSHPSPVPQRPFSNRLGAWDSPSSFAILFFYNIFFPICTTQHSPRSPQQTPCWEGHCPKPTILVTVCLSANRILPVLLPAGHSRKGTSLAKVEESQEQERTLG